MNFHHRAIQIFRTKFLTIQIKISPFLTSFVQKIHRLIHRYLFRLQVELRLLLPLTFLALLLLNLFIAKNSFDQAKNAVLADPTNASAHLSLGTQLLKNNQLLEAKRELLATSQNSASAKTKLPARLQLQTISKQEEEPAKIQDQIIFWTKIAATLPAYRDAYLKLATLNWQIDHLLDSQKFLNEALSIDPNNEVANNLLKSF